MLGTAVHRAIECFLKGEPLPPLSERAKVYYQGFLNWYEKYQPTDIQSEVFVISHQHGYAGRTDLICKINGEPHIVDIKTSRRMDPGMGLQLSAYAHAWYEMQGVRAATSVLQLTPELKRKYRFKSYEQELEVFLAHKRVFDWAMDNKLLDFLEGSTRTVLA